MYTVKELFPTLQGEGAQSGRAAIFCRFAGCNLWTGREQDRATAACRFCDTDFVGTDGEGGGKFPDAASLADAIARAWRSGAAHRYVVFTGGEPLLHLDARFSPRPKRAASRLRSKPTARSQPPPGSTGSASAPKPARRSCNAKATS